LRRNGKGSREEPVAKVGKVEEKCDQESKHRPLEMELREGESWIAKTTESITLAPMVKQIVVGMLDMPKRRESPELECVEPVQSPHTVLAARGLERTFTKPQQSTRLQRAVKLVTSGDQLSGRQISCHVQALHTSKIIPKERVKAKQASDQFVTTLKLADLWENQSILR
jgi:hypothetical protein